MALIIRQQLRKANTCGIEIDGEPVARNMAT